MSSGTIPPPSPPGQVDLVPAESRYETVIEDRLNMTRRHVKWVDVANGAVTLGIGVLGYLLSAAVLDHWLISGGLGTWGRLLLWTGLVVGAGWYFWHWLWPPLVHRISPIYAAATIEKSEPSLKNSLINFLLLRGHRREVAPVVFEAIEHRAASDLTHVQVDTAVDRSHLVRLGAVLAGLVIVFSLYVAISPKNPLRSAARVLWPWSQIDAPTRVVIRGVRPGDTDAYQGESIVISAEVDGVKDGEPVSLVYSTLDGQSVNQVVPMARPENERRQQCRFPADKLGLQQSCEYRIVAGDAQTRQFTIHAQIAPSITIQRIDYHYPAYTGIADQSVEQQGDIRAIEGTEVTIHAATNMAVKPGSAAIDLDCTGRNLVKMDAEGDSGVVGRFVLRLHPDDPSRAQHDSYQLRFADPQGRENRRPIRYRIEVIRDVPPDVQLVDAQQQPWEVAENGRLPIGVRAQDPDFALRRVTLSAEIPKGPEKKEAETKLLATLLDQPAPKKPRSGEFQGTFTFEPARLGLKAGDSIQCRAEADDNKEPEPGHALSAKQKINVVGAGRAEKPPQAADQGNGGQPKQGKRGEKPSPKSKGGDQGSQGRPSQDEQQKADDNQPSDAGKSQDKSQSNEPSQESKKPSSAEQQNQGDQSSGGSDQSGASNAGEGQSSGEQQSDKQQSGDQKSSGQQSGGSQEGQQPGDSTSDGSQGGDQGGDQGKEQSGRQNERVDPTTNPGDAIQEILKDRQEKGKDAQPQQASQEPSDKDPSQGQQPSGQQNKAGQQKSDNTRSDDMNSEDGSSDEQKAGKKKSDDKPSGKEKSGKQKGGSGIAGSAKPDGDATEADQSNTAASGDQKSGDEKSGDRKSDGANTSDASGSKKSGSDSGGKPQSPKDGETAADQQGEKQEGKPGNKSSDAQKNPQKAETQKGDDKADQRTGRPEQKMGSGEKSEKRSPSENKPTTNATTGDTRGADDAGKKQNDVLGDQAPPKIDRVETGKTARPDDRNDRQSPDKSQSPSMDHDKSKTKGDTEGDRAGDGQQGGGMQSKREGQGSRGTHTDAEQGGAQSDESGEGDAGTRDGSQFKSDKPSGNSKQQQKGDGEGIGKGDKKPGGAETTQSKDGDDSQGDDAGDGKPRESGKPAKGAASGAKAPGAGNPTDGGQPGERPGDSVAETPVDSPAEEANLEYARKQTELALEHLRDQLAKDKPDVLQRLGWTKEDAQRFLDRWEEMRRAAAKQDSAGASARKQYDNMLQSLGLRPRDARIHRGGAATDQQQNLRDRGRIAPPPEWAEQLREYNRSLSAPRTTPRSNGPGPEKPASAK